MADQTVQVVHKGQHLLRHKAQDVGYTNSTYPTIFSVKTALDELFTLVSSVLSWQSPVANKAALPLTGNTVNDARVVQDDGDGNAAIYVCIATIGTVDQQWIKIADVDWNVPSIIVDVTYYVDGDSGDDANDGLSWANAKKTMDFLYSGTDSAIPRLLNADVTVNVRGTVLSSGTVYHTIIDSFYGTGSLEIIGETTDVDTAIAITGQDNTASSITYHSYLDAGGEAFSVNAHRGQYIVITAGTGSGSNLYPIMSNTATRLESTGLPDTDGTSVIKIVSLPEFKAAQTSDPGTILNYTNDYAFEIDGISLPLIMRQLDVRNVTSTDIFSVRYVDNLTKFYNMNFDLIPLFAYTDRTKIYRSFIQLDNYRYINTETAHLDLVSTILWSSDGTGYGAYGTLSSEIIVSDSRFYDQAIAYSGDKGSRIQFYGFSVLFEECDVGIAPYMTDVSLFAYDTGVYANFKNTTTAIVLGGGRWLVGEGLTVQGTGVTTEIKISDTAGDITTFAELNAQTTIQNTATGGVVLYMNPSTFIPTQNPEYDQTTTGLAANNFQDAIDELAIKELTHSIGFGDTPYTAGTNSETVILVDTSGGDVTVNLPASASSADKIFTVKKITNDSNQITVDPNASETIDGETTKVIGQYRAAMKIVCDASNWHII